jgi:hypothetical protein
MDRLDRRTASFFAIGLLVFSFGCKSGAALNAIGNGAIAAAKVATVAAAVAQSAPPAREGGVVVVDGAPAPPPHPNCQVACPIPSDQGEGYLCATAVVTVDAATNRQRIVYECEGPLALR